MRISQIVKIHVPMKTSATPDHATAAKFSHVLVNKNSQTSATPAIHGRINPDRPADLGIPTLRANIPDIDTEHGPTSCGLRCRTEAEAVGSGAVPAVSLVQSGMKKRVSAALYLASHRYSVDAGSERVWLGTYRVTGTK